VELNTQPSNFKIQNEGTFNYTRDVQKTHFTFELCPVNNG